MSLQLREQIGQVTFPPAEEAHRGFDALRGDQQQVVRFGLRANGAR